MSVHGYLIEATLLTFFQRWCSGSVADHLTAINLRVRLQLYEELLQVHLGVGWKWILVMLMALASLTVKAWILCCCCWCIEYYTEG
ncbi:hypothetical protein VNO77_01384 [Canavalia gladiata]|uniref:Uncharacterized protein n=1 Tax=Canavalia gladiata TaxID=3824 RepID=A0AAN9MVU7_CANGL